MQPTPYMVVLVGLMCAGWMIGPSLAVARTIVVAQGNAQAADTNPGTEQRPLKTINAAAQLAQAGDTVLVHAGIYREHVAPARGGELGRPIIYQGAPGEQVIVRGSEVFTGRWDAVDGQPNTWHAKLDPSMFTGDDGRYNPFAVHVSKGRGNGTLGQVFVNAKQLSQVGTTFPLPADNGTFEPVDDGLGLVLRLPQQAPDPNTATVEISVRPWVFAPGPRGLGYIHVRGFTFEHAATQISVPQMGMVSTRSGHDWLIENNTIRFARSIGLECGAEWGIDERASETDKRCGVYNEMGNTGHHLIRNNIVTDNEQCGIAGLKSYETVIVGNVVERNARGVPGFESGGIKMHQFWDGLIEGNLVRDNGAYGIWLDNGWAGARITRNIILNNRLYGVFVELGQGQGEKCTVDDNVIAFSQDHGFYNHDSSDVWVVNNLLLDNQGLGVWEHLATRRSGATRWPDMRTENSCNRNQTYNNLFIGNQRGQISYPSPGGRAVDNHADANIFCPPADHDVQFIVNANNGLRLGVESLSADAQKAFARTGDPGLQSPVEMTRSGMVVSLAQWRTLLKSDQDSQLGTIQATLDPATCQLTINLQDLPQVQTVPVIEADRDLDNQLVPRSHPLPGPFQSLTKGTFTRQLWPVKMDTPADVQARAAANPSDTDIQLASARWFLAMAQVQDSPEQVAQLADMGRACLARIHGNPRLAAWAAATDYRLLVLQGKSDEAMARIGPDASSMPSVEAQQQFVRRLADADVMAHDAALKAGQVLVDHDPAQAAWMVGMTQSMILNETDPQVDQRLRAAAGKWMQSVLGGQPSDDVLASLSATRGRMAIAAGDVKGGADLLVAASRRASPPQKGYYWAEAARALLAAGQTDPAVELLQRILTTPETGQVRIWTAQELKRLGVEPQPAAPRPG